MAANFSEHRVQHTIRYKKQGDYGKEIPVVSPVEYQDGIKIKAGTCKKCVYGDGEFHETNCITLIPHQPSLYELEEIFQN